MSDAGQYSCAVAESPSSVSYQQFEVVVAEALLDGNDPAQLKHFNKETGSSLTVGCSFKHSARRKYFCRGECERDGILIETQGARAQRDRYSAEYEKESGTSGILYVTIKQLRESDSGRYRCYLDTSFTTDPYREFEITVTEVLPSASTTFTGTTEQSERTASTVLPSASTPPSTFTGTTEQSERTASTDVVPFVGLTLALIIILLSVSVLIFCKNRSSKPKDPPVGTEHAAVTETNTVYENIRAEGRHSRPPATSQHKDRRRAADSGQNSRGKVSTSDVAKEKPNRNPQWFASDLMDVKD
ncbi:uncharacterized protein LOC102208973 [Pundamilia nyererei]|uniref:Uncharacterized protein LOC102208973 n=1 Tax=Pundamilia nyererei TaxID=303518 RepID=A0A9Y6MCD4_9CICH|nr:PREDICTED: uncharacterized protein LOC102208973 [Pundamilia nyererei]